jgi:pimeloyl-ACP methyl ester carboxylesterase
MAKARTSDGFQLYYETHGAGPPIVLVHELGGSHASFHFQVDAWSPRFACIAYNARGYPPSDVPPRAESYAQDIAANDIGVCHADLTCRKNPSTLVCTPRV